MERDPRVVRVVQNDGTGGDNVKTEDKERGVVKGMTRRESRGEATAEDIFTSTKSSLRRHQADCSSISWISSYKVAKESSCCFQNYEIQESSIRSQ